MEEDGRREAAIASTAPLQPSFKPAGVSQDQLFKFQELHKRRLLLKSKSKNLDKAQVRKGKSWGKTPGNKDCSIDNFGNCTVEEEFSSGISIIDKREENASLQSKNNIDHVLKRQRHKLHWGLDTKERWEMKASM